MKAPKLIITDPEQSGPAEQSLSVAGTIYGGKAPLSVRCNGAEFAAVREQVPKADFRKTSLILKPGENLFVIDVVDADGNVASDAIIATFEG